MLHGRSYVKRQKIVVNDTEAIAEAVNRPTMNLVATNTIDQLDLCRTTEKAVIISAEWRVR